MTSRLRTPTLLALFFCGAFAAECAQGKTDAPRATASTPIAALNHLYAVLDDETAEAIKTSQILPQFANFKVNTVTAENGATWTGRYLSGRETYLELFSVGDLAKSGEVAKVGYSGIAISGDTPGVLSVLEQRLKAGGVPTKTDMRKARVGERDIDWFQYLAISTKPDEQEMSSIFAMEYSASFFNEPEFKKEPAEGPEDTISRERYIDDGYRNHQMRDIRALEVAVTNDDMRRIEQMLQAAGFGFLRDRGKITAHGADVDFTFHVVPADQIGLRSVEFVLNTPVPAEHIERIGKSTLTVGPGNRARWEFSESAK